MYKKLTDYFALYQKKCIFADIKDDFMAKNLLVILAFAVCCVFVAPTSGHASAAMGVIDTEYQDISVTVNSSTIHVTGANGQMLYVYNVAGVRVMSLRVDGQDRRYELNLPKGCYIVKVGKTFVRKVFIK